MDKKIEVKITTDLPKISWQDLQKCKFNDLKDVENRDISKLKRSIVSSGFRFPFYKWKDYIVDGSGRDLALFELHQEGYEIPDLPFVELQAKDIQEAKKLVLMASSKHGQITQESFDLFVQDIDIPFEEINIDEINISLENESEENNEESLENLSQYTKNIKSPVYEPVGECPNLNDLYNIDKYNDLINEINLSGLNKDEKNFLTLAASRHIVFDYSKIANYYAHSPKEIQKLMEKSALIIIDINAAIENGYVRLEKYFLDLIDKQQNDEEVISYEE